ncbi:MAG TPA: FHA domain-containing protein [Anaerolineales bacterium]|nr:FHA domain-containing protein [Anaerolineales bacterium]
MELAPIPCLSDPGGQQHELDKDIVTIGRAIENDIVVTSKRVSREHARIRREGRKLLLEDLGSTNGTFLNDERVAAPLELRDGDQVAVGEVVFTFHDPDTTTRENPFPELEINAAAGVVRVNRKVVELSPKEFALLVYLHEHEGRVCTKDEIGRAVWAEYQAGVFDYQIENLVRRLRTRIESDPANPQLLLTVRGLGYKLVEG